MNPIARPASSAIARATQAHSDVLDEGSGTAITVVEVVVSGTLVVVGATTVVVGGGLVTVGATMIVVRVDVGVSVCVSVCVCISVKVTEIGGVSSGVVVSA